MFLAVILLSATGYLSYLNLSSIVSSIRVDISPDLRLLSIREISMDLEKAENSIRIYSVTNNTGDLQPFYKIISNIDDKVNRLRAECINDSVLLEQTDTISTLIEENIFIWNELLLLNKNQQVMQSLKQISEKLNTASELDQKQEKGILKRVFSRSEKSLLNEEEIISDLNQIEKQDKILKQNMILRESQLAATGSEIKEQFYDLITKMEVAVSESIARKADDASRLARKTFRWLAMFTLTGTLLALLVIFIIIRYVRRTNSYQVALENSKNEAEKLARTKEQFMANMSHEIRTPVTAISGFTEQLLQEPCDEKTLRSLKVIKSTSDHLERIINDILDFSKLQDGKMPLEKVHFSITRVLEEVYAMFEAQAAKNNTHLSFSTEENIPQILIGDPYRLKQIIINLVSNSIKFTREGTVSFAASVVRKEGQEVDLVMKFTDSGIGIDESKLDFIFEDFTQAEMSTTRRYGGTGLGLSIVKKLVDLHNGSIDFKSRKNQGTVITCILPCRIGDIEQLKPDSESPLPIPERIRDLNILVVDDEEYNRMLFSTILDRWGVRHDEAANGMEALEMVRNGGYNLLFMDIRMPGIDGIKATEFIRGELKITASEMPVICITAASLNEDWHVYEKAGMNAFIPKPFTEKMLLTTILSVTGDEVFIAPFDKADEEDNGTGEAVSAKINLQNLYHLAGGDEDFVLQMLRTFIGTTATGLAEMKAALQEGEIGKVADIAHKLMPPCRHLGAVNLSLLLRDIEKNCTGNGNEYHLEELIDKTAGEYNEVSALLNEHIEKIKPV